MENPSSVSQLQAMCIDIKTTTFDPPVRLSSPLEAYACIGKIAKLYGLPCPVEQASLREMITGLQQEIEGNDPPGERAEKICGILADFAGDDRTDAVRMEIVEYAYETEVRG